MKRLFLLLLCFVMISCGAGKNLPVSTVPIKDSARVEIRYNTIYVTDTVLVSVPSQEASNTTKESSSHLETEFAESDASVDSTGTLHHTLKNKKGKVPVPTKTPVHSKDSIVYREKEVPVPYPVEVEVPRDLTWWQRTQMICFWIMLMLLVLKYRKTIFAFARRFI